MCMPTRIAEREAVFEFLPEKLRAYPFIYPYIYILFRGADVHGGQMFGAGRGSSVGLFTRLFRAVDLP